VYDLDDALYDSHFRSGTTIRDESDCCGGSHRQRAPFVYDAATTVVANNKITLARRSGIRLLPGWIADVDGTPIMEEVDPPPPGIDRILPLGSTREMGSHKGYGLAGVVDIMSGILTGGGYGANNGGKHVCNQLRRCL